MNISASEVKALRDRTGAGMMDCKTALIEAQGNIDDAITILRKKGMAQVAKKAGRAMKEGLVGVRLDAGATRGVIAEINCESDFVARTDDFQALVETVTTDLLAADDRDIGRRSSGPRGRLARRSAPRSPSSARTWRCRVRRASAATLWSAATSTRAAGSVCSSSWQGVAEGQRAIRGGAVAAARSRNADRGRQPGICDAHRCAG